MIQRSLDPMVGRILRFFYFNKRYFSGFSRATWVQMPWPQTNSQWQKAVRYLNVCVDLSNLNNGDDDDVDDDANDDNDDDDDANDYDDDDDDYDADANVDNSVYYFQLTNRSKITNCQCAIILTDDNKFYRSRI